VVLRDEPAPNPLRDSVVYQVYLPSFADGDGDGFGDLAGLRARMGYVKDLGVDACWITPHYESPFVDGGYDIANHRSVDPRFGTLEDFDRLLAAAHRRGLRLLIDVVPNHTSSRHPWFMDAMRGDPAARARYHFVPAAADGGPPNNWQSHFGGPAWTKDPGSGEYYLHLFAPEQPDLNWRDPSVRADFEATLRFWLERGVDGVRVDVAAGLFKDRALRDNPGDHTSTLLAHGPVESHSWDQREVHEVYRDWNRLFAGYPQAPSSVGEVSLADPNALAAYVRPDELGSAFALPLLEIGWDADQIVDGANRMIEAFARVGARPSWVLGNHDRSRIATRFGGGALGQARARAAALLLLALPGHAYLYAGDELGLEDADVPDEARQDPIFHRTDGVQKGRDGVRVPLPWEAVTPGHGFSVVRQGKAAPPWLPQPHGWGARAVDQQRRDPRSTLVLHRAAIRVRRTSTVFGHGRGILTVDDAGLLRLALLGEDGRRGNCWVNMRDAVARVPDGRVLVASGVFDRSRDGIVLPPDVALWVEER
jgi:alpha-glucosidase